MATQQKIQNSICSLSNEPRSSKDQMQGKGETAHRHTDSVQNTAQDLSRRKGPYHENGGLQSRSQTTPGGNRYIRNKSGKNVEEEDLVESSESRKKLDDSDKDLIASSKPSSCSSNESSSIVSRCNWCNEEFQSEYELFNHTRTHTSERAYQCSKCNKVCTNKVQLSEHMRIHVVDAHNLSLKCLNKFQNEQNLASHMVPHNMCSVRGKEFLSVSPLVYVCPKCHETFPNKASFDDHLRSNSEAKPDFCSVCGDTFLDKCRLVIHLKRHITETSLRSPSHYKMPPKAQLTDVQTPSSDKPYSCSECNKQYTSKRHLNTHIRKHTGDLPCQCQYQTCDKRFAHEYQLTNHMVSHSEERPHVCSECGKAFQRRSGVVKHMRLHGNDKPYKCSECDKAFCYSKELATHVRLHTGERPYSCSECNKRFNTKSNFKSHMKIHSGDKPYCCPHCVKAFCRKQQLDIHVRTHAEKKPFQCPVCKRRLSKKRYLLEHMKTHDDVKPYYCPHCNEGFVNKWGYLRHVSRHAERRAYQCPYCEHACATSSELEIHTKTKHEKPLQCPYCVKVYFQSSELMVHLLSHKGVFGASNVSKHIPASEISLNMPKNTKESAFQYNYCNAGYSTKEHLTSHLKTCTKQSISH
ncbi:gastrula zinc finger protein XlCGF57.1 isoform X2 [Strongylocentrotus purpuratus]|uniref:C2H2-type domain-containing protein n=1 Tax=Strongylocentrotus purpuratus TaxID=7668 RepID=A0A7M7HM77_STRPU|nr:gastrula zinc finger protein XlCGF57.1 isoform X2 [Strongylocentrotus purpuratus]